jgi:hypothetical protein
MLLSSVVAFAARKPSAATFESNSDDIKWTVVMSAARLVVNYIAINFDAMNQAHRVIALAPSL